ncbi:pyridoxal phosphate-dependent transferase [Favolaschia claudopus]|uniref:Pyridoxal phosphate-dependent transferase n=1 Tax=Favolaschia claudopus TaxID=2862362 RepID=A0AAW0AMB4_9AGAR
MGSWFLGNHAENSTTFAQLLSSVVEGIRVGRERIWPHDENMITSSMIESPDFKDEVEHLQKTLESVAGHLSEHSVPFYSFRYAGHMSMDVSLPAVLGYVLAQQFNQNNVTPEAGSLTSAMEYVVGQQLCYIMGFATDTSPQSASSLPVGWGHITADGSIANLESMWYVVLASQVPRNLKYYALSLKLAIQPDQELSFIASTFIIELADGTRKLLRDCTAWELLNLSLLTVATIPLCLYEQYGISSDALSAALQPFSIQTIGMEELNRRFDISQPAQYMVSVSNHYSWPKGCAIVGIGKENLVEIGVDLDIHMDITHLKTKLEECLARKQAVFCVVAVCGTTEHGAVDPVDQILELRKEMAMKGMSFMIHADAAWGGYFATKVTYKYPTPRRPSYAFSIPLNDWTNKQLYHLRFVDTITVDPHKSGYIPYSAGALCMRDSRLKFLTTWTSAYINTEGVDDLNMGIYGVEGR